MTLLGLLIAALITAVVVWLANQGKIPTPFVWIAYAVLIVVWIVVLLQVLGVNLGGLAVQ